MTLIMRCMIYTGGELQIGCEADTIDVCIKCCTWGGDCYLSANAGGRGPGAGGRGTGPGDEGRVTGAGGHVIEYLMLFPPVE